jgi:hypothetical protein
MPTPSNRHHDPAVPPERKSRTPAAALAKVQRLFDRLHTPAFQEANAAFVTTTLVDVARGRAAQPDDAARTRWLDTVALPRIVEPRVRRFMRRFGARPFWDLRLEALTDPYRRAIALATGQVRLIAVFPWTTPAEIRAEIRAARETFRRLPRPRGRTEPAPGWRDALAAWLHEHKIPYRVIYARLWEAPLEMVTLRPGRPPVMTSAPAPPPGRRTPRRSSVAQQTAERDIVRSAIARHEAARRTLLKTLFAPAAPLDALTAANLALARRETSALEVARARTALRRALGSPRP